MNEPHLGETLHAYVDNELSVEHALDVRRHLASCLPCRQDFEQVRALRGVLQRTLKPSEPSAAFLQKLRRSVRKAEGPSWHRRVAQLSWVAAPLAAAALVVSFALFSPRPSQGSLTDEVVAAHLRSLQANHLTDVLSSDRHTVKPWFEGKVPFSLPVRDFQEQGFTLEGGRLDFIGGQPVAALVYRSRKHPINAFVWPANGVPDSAPRSDSQNGIQSLHWVSDGMAWWLASDIGAADLQSLALLLRQSAQ
jgi:anti-sigma factor RsiW